MKGVVSKKGHHRGHREHRGDHGKHEGARKQRAAGTGSGLMGAWDSSRIRWIPPHLFRETFADQNGGGGFGMGQGFELEV